MVFVACGLNHKTAPLAVREQIALSANQERLLECLMEQPTIHEAIVLSTCNRTEIYCEADYPADILSFLTQALAPTSPLAPYCYIHTGNQGIQHTLRVASGLDSMMLGEPQILGQMKQAYHIASQAGGIGSVLGQLFPYIFKASKRIRNMSGIGQNPISVAFAGVQLIMRQYTDLKPLCVFLIGSGETASLVAKYLHQQGVTKFLIANRTLESAARLSAQYSGTIVPIVDIPHQLSQADILVTATSCPLPFINKRMVEQALVERQGQGMFMLDLAVPRDIEANVADIPLVHLHNIDDLNQLTETGLRQRQIAAQKAEQLIELEIDDYLRWHRSLRANPVIRDYRAQMQAIAELELERAKQKLSAGQSQENVLQEFSQRLLNKLTHLPTIGLRHAALENHHEFLDLAHSLLSQRSHEEIT